MKNPAKYIRRDLQKQPFRAHVRHLGRKMFLGRYYSQRDADKACDLAIEEVRSLGHWQIQDLDVAALRKRVKAQIEEDEDQ